MGLTFRLAFDRPFLALIRHCLKRASLILIPDLQAEGLAQRIGVLNQAFFSSLSGSLTATKPCLRLRMAMPVGHHVRVFCQV